MKELRAFEAKHPRITAGIALFLSFAAPAAPFIFSVASQGEKGIAPGVAGALAVLLVEIPKLWIISIRVPKLTTQD